MGQVFISYKSSDLLFASELFCKLAREKGLNVWFDNVRLNGGDHYDNDIKEAIRRSKIFIAILSKDVSKDLEEEGEQINHYYTKEWRWASEKKDLIILPLAIDGYDLRSPQHQVFEHLMGFETEEDKTTGINMSEKVNNYMVNEKTGFAKLLDSIYNHLGVTEL